MAGIFLLSASITFGQETSPTPQTATQPSLPREVIVTGSNIPTAEEVGPHPVDTYRREDITRLGVRSATDFVQKLPAATGPSINENVNTSVMAERKSTCAVLAPKKPWSCRTDVVSRRLALPVIRSTSTPFPLGLIDHIDILKDGASAIYGSDAVGGVFNVWLIHRFRGLEIYASYGNTNLGASNDQGEERAYLLAGTGDDKTDIVVYAEVYNRAAIYSRDADISSNADFTRFGGTDLRSGGLCRTRGSGTALFTSQP